MHSEPVVRCRHGFKREDGWLASTISALKNSPSAPLGSKLSNADSCMRSTRSICSVFESGLTPHRHQRTHERPREHRTRTPLIDTHTADRHPHGRLSRFPRQLSRTEACGGWELQGPSCATADLQRLVRPGTLGKDRLDTGTDSPFLHHGRRVGEGALGRERRGCVRRGLARATKIIRTTEEQLVIRCVQGQVEVGLD